jgi:hypothetical protein
MAASGLACVKTSRRRGRELMKLITLRRVEWVTAILLTLAVLVLLIVRAQHAGGLWRDECASVQLAEMPTLSDHFHNFQRESFPAFFPLSSRAYTTVFGTSDAAFRAFGIAVGVLLLVVAWFNSRILAGSPPLISLALLGFNISFLTWGITIRGYGIGSVLILFAFGLIARLLLETSKSRIAAALLAAVASVQVLLYNSVLLAAMTAAVLTVCVIQRKFRPALATTGIASVCAVSMLPYLRPFWTESQSTVVLQGPVTLGWFWRHLERAFGDPLHLMTGVWVGLFAAVIVGAAIRLCFIWSKKPAPEWDLLSFGLIAAIISVIGYFAFLKIISYSTREWYYLALLSILAGAIDLLAAVLSRITWVRAARLTFVIASLIGMPIVDWPVVTKRQTNVDLVARKLEEIAQPHDLIVLNPWFYGVTFNWYYHGATPWVTSPMMSDHRVHRFDLLKAKMMASNPIDDLRKVIGRTLQSGNRVWFVGGVQFLPLDEAPVPLLPAPNSEFGWNLDVYADSWSQQLGLFLREHAVTGQFLPVGADQPVNDLENVPLLVIEGWRE